ncbi:cytochrome c oxidase assembly factor Coa1 family protein [Stenotrophomonas sp. Iso1]|uniref:cytochrome c oxidase assembly factor Coa1 family protein n=1 Tax=Stenotrophomonas sp. Iso1 TaxID=2977283 RepID=UPI0022B78EC2|nr:cytochrome c oxidase assembly factor Coa1 family protein [Stenotrophomonas sp. Iso1]
MSTKPPPLPGSMPGKPPRNWLQRNLKWLLPLLMLGVVGTFAWLFWRGYHQVEGHMQQDSPYLEAIKRASSSDEMKTVLGTPLQVTLVAVEGAIEGDAAQSGTYRFRAKGPKCDARIVAEARRVEKRWVYDRFAADIEGWNVRLDLRTDEEKACAAQLPCD